MIKLFENMQVKKFISMPIIYGLQNISNKNSKFWKMRNVVEIF